MRAYSDEEGYDVYPGAEEQGFENSWRAERQAGFDLAARQESEQHFEKIYTDPAYFEEIAKDPRIAEAEKHSLKPEEVRYGAANRSFLSHHVGRKLTGVEYEAVRGAYTKKQFGKHNVHVTDKEFYELVKGQYEAKQERRTAATDLYTDAIKQTLEDEAAGKRTAFVDVYSKWKKKNAELVDDKDEAQYYVTSLRVIEKAKQDIEKFKGPASRVFQTLTKYTQGEASEEDIQSLGEELASIPRADRKTLYKYAVVAAQASGEEDMGVLEQAAKNLGQSISRGFSWLEGPKLTGKDENLKYDYIPLAAVERQSRVRLMQLERQPDSPERRMEEQSIKRTIEMTQVVREMKEVARTGVDPIKPIFPDEGFFSAGKIERGIYGFGGSLGYMTATGISPMLGTLVAHEYEYNRMRLENPDMDPHVAGAASLASAVAQTSIEVLQIQTMAGRLPIFSQFLKDMPVGITRTAAAVGLGLASENVEEGVQDAISELIPMGLAALRSDMPDKDPGKVFGDYMNQRAEVFWAVLPLGLVAGGFASFKDYKNEGNELLNEKVLQYFGFNPKQSEAILSAEDPTAAVQAEAPARTERAITSGIKAMSSDIAAAAEMQKNPNMPTLASSVAPDGKREWTVTRNSPETSEQDVPYLTPAEMKGQNVAVNMTDPATGAQQQVIISAEAGQAMTKRNIDAYSILIDCLLK